MNSSPHKMQILFIVPYTPTPIRTRPCDPIRGLAARGHQVTPATLWQDEEERVALERLDDFRQSEHRAQRRVRVRKANLQFFLKHYSKPTGLALRLLLAAVSLAKSAFWAIVTAYPPASKETG